MEDSVIVSSALINMLADLKAVGGTLTGAEIQPFVNDVDPGPGAVLGDFDLATFVDGATQQTVVWGESFLNGDLAAETVGGLIQFDWDSGTSETVYGFLLTEAGGDLIGYCRLTTPKVMAATSDSLPVLPRFVLPVEGYGRFIAVLEG